MARESTSLPTVLWMPLCSPLQQPRDGNCGNIETVSGRYSPNPAPTLEDLPRKFSNQAKVLYF